jgi:hydrogenase-4 component B
MLVPVLGAIALLLASALAAVVLARSDRAALGVGTVGCVAACLIGGGASLGALLRGDADTEWRARWSPPVGELHAGLDALSAFFLLCVFVVSGLAAVYGAGYLRAYFGRRPVAPAVAWFGVLVAAMAALLVARDGVLFLVAWEAMTIASFFLVTFEHEREEVRAAGMTYLVASQLGVVFLFVLFAVLSRGGASWDFDAMGPSSRALASVCFGLAVVGFGTKAGFWPLHVWLPEAHPAAPSHVSALMSGVMIKMGIYGLLRTLSMLGGPDATWGGILVAVGGVSAIAGVLHAVAQRDLKRRLAFSSVENVGIVAMAIGLGVIAKAHGHASVAMLAVSGGLLHVLNHGLFKGLLFQGAGAVLHATGTRDMDALGGLSRRMPFTAAMFLVGAVAICGLPPLNGFVGEWLVYVASFRAASSMTGASAVGAVILVPMLALAGGLAVACFVGAYGVVFLGEPRTSAAERAHEAPAAMRAAMALGALACIAIGIWPAGVLRVVGPAARQLVGADAASVETAMPYGVTRVALVLVLLVLALAFVRGRLLRGRAVRTATTWGCGYAAPSPRMQYTASSFGAPLLEPFVPAVPIHETQTGPTGLFPLDARHEERVGDLAGDRLFLPAFRGLVRAFSRAHVLQAGRVHVYLAYVLVTLVVLLAWQLRGTP